MGKAYFVAVSIAGLACLQWLEDLWLRFKARHIEPMGDGHSFRMPRWFGWYIHRGDWEGRGEYSIEAFVFHVPFVRSFRITSALINFELGYLEGWHYLMVSRISVRGAVPSGPCVTWQHEWLPIEAQCRKISEEEAINEHTRKSS
jgi:hypothetical protein